MTNVMITMAGMGKRFRDAGYAGPKYTIKVHQKTLFTWSMLSLRSFYKSGAKFIFVVQRADQAVSFIYQECQSLGISSIKIIEIDGVTDGQATTALFGESAIDAPYDPFLVYNIDTFVHPDALPIESVRGDGFVPCFPGEGDGFSFALADEHGLIIDLKEKVRISSHATVGFYWFSSFHLYAQTYHDYYRDLSRLEKGEKYIAPMYRQMIQTGQSVFLHAVQKDAVIPLGTPAEVGDFLNRQAPVI